MLKSTHLITCLLATLVLACLASAQLQQPITPQQQPTNQILSNNLTAPIIEAPVCISTATKPTPETKKYVFQTCIVAELAAYLSIGPNQYIELNNGSVNTNLSVCNNTTLLEPMLVINFECGSLSLIISHVNETTFVKSINGLYNLNGTTHTFANTTALFSTTQSGHYYKCKAEQEILVGNVQTLPTNLVLSNFALEAYRSATGTDFYQIPEECPLDSQPVSDLVRLGVGICLIALVAIVLIAYFIGRRRWSERSSYESV